MTSHLSSFSRPGTKLASPWDTLDECRKLIAAAIAAAHFVKNMRVELGFLVSRTEDGVCIVDGRSDEDRFSFISLENDHAMNDVDSRLDYLSDRLAILTARLDSTVGSDKNRIVDLAVISDEAIGFRFIVNSVLSHQVGPTTSVCYTETEELLRRAYEAVRSYKSELA